MLRKITMILAVIAVLGAMAAVAGASPRPHPITPDEVRTSGPGPLGGPYDPWPPSAR
jgi:hypothetical protein